MIRRLLWLLVPPAIAAAGCAPAADVGVAPDPDVATIERMYEGYRREAFADLPDLSADDLRERGPETVVLVDCREDDERAISMIPGAISIADFEADRERYRPRPIVAYCTIGYRSGVFAARLRDASFDASNLRGGVLGWAHAGGTFIDAAGAETRRVHVYGPDWDLLPEGYESVGGRRP